ncbi:hypothetical protein F2Q69_00051159 [Brassica cretica]|uniref:Uncharacterized protein n=1 Tax=Brassica cretica TaxID=69181 RepID=A0A8S9PIF1_BRACR|nr:hypothetical protein F2Q69_00051159 [Brassica cretica]
MEASLRMALQQVGKMMMASRRLQAVGTEEETETRKTVELLRSKLDIISSPLQTPNKYKKELQFSSI